MKFFCLEDFKLEFEKLISKKAYNTLEQDLINYFFGKSAQELSSGTRLNNSDQTPYIKKRLNRSLIFNEKWNALQHKYIVSSYNNFAA